jgi:hypothetical protein
MFIRDRSTVFVHIPKTGGNSTILRLVNSGLLPPENLTTRHPTQDGENRFGYTDDVSPSKHATAENQISRLVQMLEKEPGLLPRKQIEIVFTLRNPIERLTSLALHGSDGKFSLVRIFKVLRRPSVSQKVLLSDDLLSRLREREISIEWVVLDFDKLETSISRWLGSEWTRSRDDGTVEPMPRVNVSKSNSSTRAVTRGLIGMFIFLSPSSRDFRLKPGKFVGDSPTA